MKTAKLQDYIPICRVSQLAPKIAPAVHCVSVQTVYNWVKHGRRGQKLSTVTIGGRIFTTEDDLRSFLSNFTQVKN